MSIFNKTREKIQNIDKIVSEKEELEEKFKDILGKFCFDGKDIIVYEYFSIDNFKICLSYRDITIPEDRVFTAEYSKFKMKHGDDFLNKHRSQFCRIRHQLKVFGYQIKKIIEENE